MNQITRFAQPGKVECGPASICMLASIYKDISHKFSVDSVINIIGTENIKNGSNVLDLAKCVEILSENKLLLLYKFDGSIEEIEQLIKQGIPAVVDWQGSTFDDDDGLKGHYTVIINVINGKLEMIDSLPDFTNGRTVSVSNFLKLWWDIDFVTDKLGGEKEIKTSHLFFIIVPKLQSEQLLKQYNLKQGNSFGFDPS
jgi:hypothetical protein